MKAYCEYCDKNITVVDGRFTSHGDGLGPCPNCGRHPRCKVCGTTDHFADEHGNLVFSDSQDKGRRVLHQM